MVTSHIGVIFEFAKSSGAVLVGFSRPFKLSPKGVLVPNKSEPGPEAGSFDPSSGAHAIVHLPSRLVASRGWPVGLGPARRTLCCLLARYLVVKEPDTPPGTSRLIVRPARVSVFRGAITARAWHPLPITILATTRRRYAAAEFSTIASPRIMAKIRHLGSVSGVGRNRRRP